MATMSIRGLNEKALQSLKRRAASEGTSLNALVLTLLEGEDVGSQRNKSPTFDDLDALAGTWSAKDAKAFNDATAAFGEIDAKLWR